MSSLPSTYGGGAETTAPQFRFQSLATLLPVACPAALLALVIAGIRQQIVVPDTWVALVSGREIATHGLPWVEHLTSLAQGREWVDQQWFAQLVLYAAERAGGFGSMVALCLICVVLAFALAARAAHERGASPFAILAFFVGAFLAGPWAVEARTQALALPLFSSILWLLLRDANAERRSTLWVLPILCLWANVHGSVVLGAALVSAYGLQALVRRGWERQPAALAVLAPVTVLASPYALRLPGYYRLMLFDSPFGREIVEWERTTPSARTAVFFTLVLLTAALLVLRRRRVTLLDCLLLTVSFAAALSAIRLVPWFALTMLAVVPSLATRRRYVAEFDARGAAALTALTVAGLAAITAWTASQPYRLTSSHARGLAAIRANAQEGRLFVDLTMADWLLWRMPELRGRIAYDGRPELLTSERFNAVVRFARHDDGWREVVRGYSLVISSQPNARRLTTTKRWRRVYHDRSFSVFRHVG